MFSSSDETLNRDKKVLVFAWFPKCLEKAFKTIFSLLVTICQSSTPMCIISYYLF